MWNECVTDYRLLRSWAPCQGQCTSVTTRELRPFKRKPSSAWRPWSWHPEQLHTEFNHLIGSSCFQFIADSLLYVHRVSIKLWVSIQNTTCRQNQSLVRPSIIQVWKLFKILYLVQWFCNNWCNRHQIWNTIYF